MSKGFNALNDLRKDSVKHLDSHVKWLNERLDIIEKELAALQFLKKILPIIEYDFWYDEDTEKYYFMGAETTKENYDLLKEVILEKK